MKIKSYYYVILGVFCLFLENQTLFGVKVQIPEEVMQVLNDQNYREQHDQIMAQQKASIQEGYKAHLCNACNIDPESFSDEALIEWIQEDLKEGIKVGPEYYVLARVRQYHEEHSDWTQKSQNDFFSDSGKSCYDNGVRPEDFESSAGETNVYWALYQAGLTFMQTEPEFAMFCFKHLLILSNGQIPAFLFPGFNASSNSIRRISVAFRMLSNHYFNQSVKNQDALGVSRSLNGIMHRIMK
jgi:hypothetical protein